MFSPPSIVYNLMGIYMLETNLLINLVSIKRICVHRNIFMVFLVYCYDKRRTPKVSQGDGLYLKRAPGG